MKQRRKFLVVTDVEAEALRIVKLERGSTYDSVLTPYEEVLFETKSHSKAVRYFNGMLPEPEVVRIYYIVSDDGFDGLRLDREIVHGEEQWFLPRGNMLVTEDYQEAKEFYDKTLAERLADVRYIVKGEHGICNYDIVQIDGTERYADVVGPHEDILFESPSYDEASEFYDKYIQKLKADVEYLVIANISACTCRIVTVDGTVWRQSMYSAGEGIYLETPSFTEAEKKYRYFREYFGLPDEDERTNNHEVVLEKIYYDEDEVDIEE